MFKRSIILITLACSVVLSLFAPLVANAASIYDEGILTTNELYTNSWRCSPEDKVSMTPEELGSFLADSSNWNYPGQYSEYFPQFQSNLDSDGAYGVTRVDQGGSYYINYFFRSDNASSIEGLFGFSLPPEGQPYLYTLPSPASIIELQVLMREDIGSGCVPVVRVNVYSPNQQYMISGNLNIYTYGAKGITVDYPEGYEGERLPDDSPKEALIPQFDWQVQASGAFTVRYTGNLAEKDIKPYGTFNLDVDKCENLDELCTDEVVNFSPQRPAYSAKWEGEGFTLPSEGVYVFFVGYYNNPPLLPLDIEGVMFYVEWDGKSFISGSTDPKSKITPLGYGINPIWSALNSASTPTYGLQAVVMAPFGFIQGLTQQVANCTPITMPSVYDFQFKFDCIGTKLKNDFPAAVAIYQTVLTAVVFYWVGIKFFGWVRDVNKPHRDNIEVYRL